MALRPYPCLVKLPAAWSRRLAASKLYADHVGSGARYDYPAVPAPGGSGLLSTQVTSPGEPEQPVVLRGKDGQVVRRIGAAALRDGAAGGTDPGADTADGRRVAFFNAYGSSYDNTWSLYVWDSMTGKLTHVADNPVDKRGNPMPGGAVVPVLSAHYLYWIQPSVDRHHVTDTGFGSELMQYEFATGKTRVLYDGVVNALVPYHREIIYVALPAGPHPGAVLKKNGDRNFVTRALDPVTGNAFTPPQGLDAGPDAPYHMVTNGDVIAWDTYKDGIKAWSPRWGKTINLLAASRPSRLIPPDDEVPQIYGHILVFGRTYVMDLRTDSMAQLTRFSGRHDLNGQYLGLWQSAGDKLSSPYDAYLMDLAKLPDLPSCH